MGNGRQSSGKIRLPILDSKTDYDMPISFRLSFLLLCLFFAFNAVAQSTSPSREYIYNKLNRIQVTAVYQDKSLDEVLRDLTELSRKNDPEHLGIHFLFAPQKQTGTNEIVSASSINVHWAVRNVPLQNLLDGICHDSPNLKYFVKDGAIVFAVRDFVVPKCEIQLFKVDTNKFLMALHQKMPYYKYYPVGPPAVDMFQPPEGLNWLEAATPPDEITILARQYFKELGVDIYQPKSVLFSFNWNALVVIATSQDLEVIEQAIGKMNVETDPISSLQAHNF